MIVSTVFPRIGACTVTLKANARNLRKTMTLAECLLWQVLRRRALGAKFRRQMPIGRYIPDFACPERGLVIEVDGSQHAECSADQTRDAWLRAQGFEVLRFWNIDILQNLEGVYERIQAELRDRPRRFPPSR